MNTSNLATERPAAVYGLVAEFPNEQTLLAGIRQMRTLGYQQLDAFTPYPVEGTSAALGMRPTRIPLFTLAGGIAGGISAYAMMDYTSVTAYPLNIGGRPLHSWPSFIPITFELVVLGAALTAFLGMLLGNRLPRLHHPLFNLPEFDTASTDRFFLCVHAEDPHFDTATTPKVLADLPAARVFWVPL